MIGERNKTILLVEDEAIIAVAEAMTLEKYGYKVITALSGEKAITTMDDTPGIDLVLMDINLGKGMDGTRAAEIILGKHTVPLIFLSSHTERDVVEKTEGITSYGYIVKNSGETVLIASIKMAFRLFESRMKEQENDEFRKRVFESSLVPIVIMDGETFAYLDCNPATVSIYGFSSKEETLGKTPYDVSAPHQYDGSASSKMVRHYTDIAIAEGLAVFEWRHQRPSGELWDAEVHMMSFYSKDQLFLQFTLQDITLRKQAETALRESEEIFRLFMEYSPIYVFFKDERIRPISLSRNFEKMLGIPIEEMLGKTMDDLFPSELAKNMVADDLRILKEGKSLMIEEEFNGRFYSTIKFPIHIDGKPRYLSGYTIDVTERRQFEKMQQIKQELFIDLDSVTDLRNGLNKVLNAVVQLDCIDCGAIYITAPANGSLDMIAHQGFSSEFAKAISHIPIGSPKVRMVLTGNPFYGTYAEILPEIDEVRAREGLRALAAIPVMSQGQLIAVLSLASHSHESIPNDTRRSLETIAFQTGGALVRLQIHGALRESEQRFRNIYEAAQVGIVITTPALSIEKANPAFCYMIGYREEELKSMTFADITHPDYFSRDTEIKLVASGEMLFHRSEKQYMHKDGSVLWGDIIVSGIRNEHGVLESFLFIINNITAGKQAEDEIRSLLQEKTLMLKEVHHRIKNNISSIESLLTLQSYSTKNTEALSLLQNAVSQVQSMRILYENLLISENYSDISTKTYFENLIQAIIALYPNAGNITIETNISDFVMNTKVIIPVGIIINELITNSMKYAFAGRAHGVLRVDISRELNSVLVIIADDGAGLPAGFNSDKNKGFGYMLVDMLVEQIGGSIKIENKMGMKCKIEFEMF